MAWYRLVNGHNTFKAYIKVYSRTVGAIATATDGTYTYTAVVGSNNYAEIKVIKAGTYAVSCTGTTKTISMVISSEGTYTAQYVWSKYLVETRYTAHTDTELTTRSAYRASTINDITVARRTTGTVAITLNAVTGRWSMTNVETATLTVGLDAKYYIPSSDLPFIFGTDDNGNYTGHGLDNSSTQLYVSRSAQSTSLLQHTENGHWWNLTNAERWYRESYGIKGDYVEQVTSTYPDTYSDDGITGDYWYTAA